jgi:nucleoprotein TPR
VSQPEPAPVTEPTSADHPSTEEVDTLKEQLAEARKALEDVRANAESAAAAPSETTADVKADAVQDDAETATLKTELEERETKLKEAEAALGQRESKVSTREGKVAEIQKKAQDKIHSIRNESNEKIAVVTKDLNDEIARLKEEIAELQAEINKLREAPQQSTVENTNNATVVYKNLLDEETSNPALLNKPIDTEGLARPTVTASEFKVWINKNDVARMAIAEQIRKHIDPLKEQVKTKEAELAQLNQQLSEVNRKTTEPIKAEDNQTQHSTQAVEAALAQAKTEHEQALEKALKQATMRSAAKVSMLEIGSGKWKAIEKISKETPTLEVSKAVPMAVEEAKKAKQQAALPVQPAVQSQPPTSSVAGLPLTATAPSQQPSQQSGPTANNAHQPNGTNVPAQQANLATQPVQHAASNPFMNPQFGRGLAQPGFTGQGQFPNQQQQQQQGGRGQAAGMGTGPRAPQGTIGNQSGIPRGGASAIPQPGGRGRLAQPQQQQNPNQPPNNNAQGAGASQIGRGGNRGGRGGGRGGAQSNQNSPRNSLNPGAAQFQPQPGMGRGQKRGPEDEGDGSARGGKRARGRGGQGGGAPQGE